MKLLLLITLACFACTNTKKSITENSIVKSVIAKNQEVTIEKINLKQKFDKADEEMRFKIKAIEQKDEALMLEVSYGGGCIDNHAFELYSTGKPDENGVIDMFLLHKTLGDHCKMLLIQQRIFDISKLSKHKNFISFRINGGEIVLAKKTK